MNLSGRLLLGLALSGLFALAVTRPVLAGPEPKDQASLLINALNEIDTAKRDALVSKVFPDSGILADQAVRAAGHKAIAARIETLQRSLPGQTFQLIGNPQRQHDAWRIAYEVVDKTGSTSFEGLIFAISQSDGRFERVDLFAGPSAIPLP